MHSSQTGWPSPTGSHSVIWRRAQRSAGRQLPQTTQSCSTSIGMVAVCSPKVTNPRPKDGLSMKMSRSMSDWAPSYARHVANADSAAAGSSLMQYETAAT
jgi:hypothetical protein